MKFGVDADLHSVIFLSQQQCLNITDKDFDSVHAHRHKTHLGN